MVIKGHLIHKIYPNPKSNLKPLPAFKKAQHHGGGGGVVVTTFSRNPKFTCRKKTFGVIPPPHLEGAYKNCDL